MDEDQLCLSFLTFHVVIIVTHVCVLSKQGGAGRGGDASTDPLHAHLLLQTLDPAWALQTDVNHLAKDLQCNQDTGEERSRHWLPGIKLMRKCYRKNTSICV